MTKFDFIKILKIYSVKDTVKRTPKTPRMREKIANHIPDKSSYN